MSWGPLCFLSYCTIRGVLHSPTTSVPAGHLLPTHPTPPPIPLGVSLLHTATAPQVHTSPEQVLGSVWEWWC